MLRTPAFAFGVFGGVYEASYAMVSFFIWAGKLHDTSEHGTGERKIKAGKKKPHEIHFPALLK